MRASQEHVRPNDQLAIGESADFKTSLLRKGRQRAKQLFVSIKGENNHESDSPLPLTLLALLTWLDDKLRSVTFVAKKLPGVSALTPAWKAGVEWDLSETPGSIVFISLSMLSPP